MSRRSNAVALLAVLVSAGAVVGIESSPQSLEASPRSPTVVAVPQSMLSCPLADAGSDTTTRVLGVTPAGSAEAVGATELLPLSPSIGMAPGPDPDVLATAGGAGAAIQTRLEDSAGAAVVFSAEGGLAPGIAAFQWTTSTDRDVPSLAVSRCEGAARQWWFNGIDTSLGARSQLVLTNTSRTIAIVDLDFAGSQGPVNAVGASGVAVAPGSRTELDLARFAPGLEAAGLTVTATQGTVVAAVRTDAVLGASMQGSEWLPPAAPPASEVLVGPSPAGAGDRSLLITNPGTREALVQVRVIDEDGAFAPTQLKDLRVPPGTVSVNDLRPISADAPVAVQLSSSVPVTAATVSGGDQTPEDFAVTSTSPTLTGPAVVPVVEDASVTLSFASVARGGARVSVETFDVDGTSLARQTLDLRGAVVTRWQPPGEDTRAAYLVVSVLSGDQVRGVATYEGSQGLASIALVSGIRTITRPAVSPLPISAGS